MSLKIKKNLFWGFVMAVSIAVIAMVAAPKAIAALTTTGGEITNVQKSKSATGTDCLEDPEGIDPCYTTTPPDECETE